MNGVDFLKQFSTVLITEFQKPKKLTNIQVDSKPAFVKWYFLCIALRNNSIHKKFTRDMRL